MNRDLVIVGPLEIPALDSIGSPFNPPQPVEWCDLPEVLASARPSTIVFAGLGVEGDTALLRIQELLRRFPSVAVVVATAVCPDTLPDVAELLAGGASDVLDLLEEVTPRAIAQRLQQTHARPFKRRLEEVMPQRLRPDARRWLMAAAEVAVDGGGVANLAAALRLTPRNVTNAFASSGLPTPRLVQGWMRVLLACALLEDPGRTSSGVAIACGYRSSQAMTRSLKRVVGEEAPTRWRGVFSSTASLFFGGVKPPQDAEVSR